MQRLQLQRKDYFVEKLLKQNTIPSKHLLPTITPLRGPLFRQRTQRSTTNETRIPSAPGTRRSKSMTTTTDKHVKAVRTKLRDRERAGLRKYGVTTKLRAFLGELRDQQSAQPAPRMLYDIERQEIVYQ